MLTSKLLNQISGIKHAFCTRIGGVSQGLLGSLNFSMVKEELFSSLVENHRIVREQIGPEVKQILTLQQKHTNKVLSIEAPWALEELNAPIADGMLTRTKGLGLGILTADCAPILLASSDGACVSAVHAGWRGALKGVIESAVSHMRQQGAHDIVAAIGPCIAQESYEVGPDLVQEFQDKDQNAAPYFKPAEKERHFYFDLRGYVEKRLREASINSIDHIKIDTYTNVDQFYSCRRAFHKREETYGCQMSAIVKS